MLAYYFGYGANMSKRYLKNLRNIIPASSQSAYMPNYKLVMNIKGPNFVEPAFANICPEKNSRVEGVLHDIKPADLDRIVASEGETYEMIEASVKVDDKIVSAQTLVCPEKISNELPTSRRYMKILIAAAEENNLSSNYIQFLKGKKSVYYPILSEIFSLRVYFWVKTRAK